MQVRVTCAACSRSAACPRVSRSAAGHRALELHPCCLQQRLQAAGLEGSCPCSQLSQGLLCCILGSSWLLCRPYKAAAVGKAGTLSQPHAAVLPPLQPQHGRQGRYPCHGSLPDWASACSSAGWHLQTQRVPALPPPWQRAWRSGGAWPEQLQHRGGHHVSAHPREARLLPLHLGARPLA